MHTIPWKGSEESESNKDWFTSVNNVHVTSALINHPVIWFKDKNAKSKSPLTDFYMMLPLIELLL